VVERFAPDGPFLPMPPPTNGTVAYEARAYSRWSLHVDKLDYAHGKSFGKQI
jgi:hypothetical protein